MNQISPASALRIATPLKGAYRLFVTLWGLIQITTALHATGTPEYIAAQSPEAATLDDANNPTDPLGFIDPLIKLDEKLSQLGEHIPQTGSAFIDETQFKLTSRSYYRHREVGKATSEAFATGGSFGLKTGYWQDIASVGLTAFTSQKLYGPDDRDGTGLLKPGQSSYTLLGEAYLELKFEPTKLALGYQQLDLPYINGHDIRMTPHTFEAYTALHDVNERLRIGIGYVNKIRTRTSYDYQYMSEQAGAAGTSDGVYAIGMRYKIEDRFNLGWVDLYNPDTFNTFYIESSITHKPKHDIAVKTSVQFTDQVSVGDELIGEVHTQHYGIKCASTYSNLTAAAIFTYTDTDHDVLRPWGGSPSYNSIMIGDFDRAGERSYGASLSYDFTAPYLKDFSTSLRWVYGDISKGDSPDQRELNLNLDYRPDTLENLWVRVRYGSNETLGDSFLEEIRDFRIIINYALAF